MVDKKILLKEFIRNNPTLKASEIYNKTKGTSLGTRKTEVLKTVREVRKLPEPSIAKKEQSIPIKHRTTTQKRKIAKRQKAKPIKVKPTPTSTPTTKKVQFPTEKGSYGVVEVSFDGKDSKWIKFRNKKDFERQLDIIKKNYGKKLNITFHGVRELVSFIDQDFKNLLPFL